MKALITPPLCPLKDARLCHHGGGKQIVPELRKTAFGLLAETRKKKKTIVVGQTGTFHHQPDNSPSIPHPGGLLFSPPASCHHLGIESNDSRVYFSVSKKDRQRERERERKTGVIWSGLGVSLGHRKPGLCRCLTKAFHLLQLS